ncbi:efflux RND transporter permease subunit, partial [Salmonella sp. SAL4449]|uniref:efflux RND transporter permease subunit n=1 Tax=Salmonella sp. SAL4449 TaxID=3159904 RepID=UPI0039781550
IVLVPPPIQGLGLSGGFQMQVELTDGSEDYVRLQEAADRIVARAREDPAIRMILSPLRASVPQLTIRIEKTAAENLGVDVGD